MRLWWAEHVVAVETFLRYTWTGCFGSNYKCGWAIIRRRLESTRYSLRLEADSHPSGGGLCDQLTPVSPHSLNAPPLVCCGIGGDCDLCESGGKRGIVSFDGQRGKVHSRGRVIRCRKLAHKFKLLLFYEYFLLDGFASTEVGAAVEPDCRVKVRSSAVRFSRLV